jgi:hypothetical protein
MAWGAVALTLLSLDLARRQRVGPGPLIIEHLGVAVLVVIAAQLVGIAVSALFS